MIGLSCGVRIIILCQLRLHYAKEGHGLPYIRRVIVLLHHAYQRCGFVWPRHYSGLTGSKGQITTKRNACWNALEGHVGWMVIGVCCESVGGCGHAPTPKKWKQCQVCNERHTEQNLLEHLHIDDTFSMPPISDTLGGGCGKSDTLWEHKWVRLYRPPYS